LTHIKLPGSFRAARLEVAMSSLKLLAVVFAVAAGSSAWAMQSPDAPGSRSAEGMDLLSTWWSPEKDARLLFTWSQPVESKDLLYTWWQPPESSGLVFAFSSPDSNNELTFTWSRPDESKELLFTWWSRPVPETQASGSAGGEPGMQ
jgi:hypothetical protein